MPFPEGAQLLALGKVSHITEQLVVIQSLPDTPPVDEGTVLWSEDKKSLSVVCGCLWVGVVSNLCIEDTPLYRGHEYCSVRIYSYNEKQHNVIGQLKVSRRCYCSNPSLL